MTAVIRSSVCVVISEGFAMARKPRRTIKSKSNAGSRGRATYRRPPCCVTAVRGAWECINANRTGYTVTIWRGRGSTVQLTQARTYIYISDIMACRLCVVQCVALRVQWNNSLARNKIMIMEYPSSSLRLPRSRSCTCTTYVHTLSTALVVGVTVA